MAFGILQLSVDHVGEPKPMLVSKITFIRLAGHFEIVNRLGSVFPVEVIAPNFKVIERFLVIYVLGWIGFRRLFFGLATYDQDENDQC